MLYHEESKAEDSATEPPQG